MTYIYILKFKKPHKWFFTGDIVLGEIHDGQAERMKIFGWSKKLNKFISNYYCSYQGWHWKDNKTKSNIIRDGRGYLRIKKTIEVVDQHTVSDRLGIYFSIKYPRRFITSKDESMRFFNELLSAGKVEPYKKG